MSLLRIFLKCIMVILALPLLLLLGVMLVNSFDEPLDEKTQQWLAYVPVPVPENGNAFYILLSLDAQVDDPAAAAAEVVRSWRELYLNPQNSWFSSPDYESVRQKTLRPLQRSIDPLLGCKDDCYRSIVEHADRFKSLITQQSRALARFDSMLELPGYADDIVVGDQNTPIADYRPALQLSTLYLAQVVFDAQAGKEEQACRNWVLNQSFWYRAANGTHNLIGVVAPRHAIDRGVEILQKLAHDNAAFAAAARDCAVPVLERSDELLADMAKAEISEFQRLASILGNVFQHCTFLDMTQCRVQGQSLKWYERFEVQLLRRNASLNLARRVRENELAHEGLILQGYQFSSYPELDGRCIWWGLSLYNPLGKLLVCSSEHRGSFDQYLQPIRETTTKSEEAVSALRRGNT